MERSLRQRLTTMMRNMVFIQPALLWLASGLIGWGALGCAPATAQPAHARAGVRTITPVLTFTPTATAVRATPTPMPTSTPTAVISTPTPTPVVPRVNRGANLRAGPGTHYPVVGGLPVGYEVAPQARFGDWLQLRLGVWIYAPLVNDSPPDLPVAVAIPPTPTPTITPSPTPFVTKNPSCGLNCSNAEILERNVEPLLQFDMVCRLSDQSLSVTNHYGNLDTAVVITAVEHTGGTFDVHETVSSWCQGETKMFYAAGDETTEFKAYVLYNLSLLYANGHGGVTWDKHCIVDVTPTVTPTPGPKPYLRLK